MTVKEIFKTPIFLAPMAGITDAAFRILVRELITDESSKKNLLMFSEMISSAAIHFRNVKTMQMLKLNEDELPISIQLFGSEPNLCAEATRFVDSICSVSAIDFNAGCPVPKIVKNGEGAALLKNPKHLENILIEMRNATRLPISVKIRIGFDSLNINATEVAQRAENAGVDFITVHGRTREQFYSGSADWEEIAKIKTAVKIPVIANGDINDIDSLDKVLKITHADGFMIGRAARGNPWIIDRLLEYFLTGKNISPPSIIDYARVMKEHLKKIIHFKGERIGLLEMRAHAANYTKGLKNGARLRKLFNCANTVEDFLRIVEAL